MKFAIDITTGVHLGPNSFNGNTNALCPECRGKVIVYSNKEVEHESCCGNCKYYPQSKIHDHPTFLQVMGFFGLIVICLIWISLN